MASQAGGGGGGGVGESAPRVLLLSRLGHSQTANAGRGFISIRCAPHMPHDRKRHASFLDSPASGAPNPHPLSEGWSLDGHAKFLSPEDETNKTELHGPM